MEKVVIAIPARNSDATLRQTIESALAQTYRNLRIVVIDNASTDDTALIAADFARRDSRVELKSFKELVSAEDNFNRCLKEANGALIAILHADDLYEAEMIAEQVAFFERHPECSVVFANAKTIDSKGEVTGRRFIPAEFGGKNALLNYEDMLSLVLKYGNFITCPSAMMKSAVFLNELGGWNGAEFGSSADLDLWLRAARHGRVGFIAHSLMRYRVSEFSYSVHLQKVRTIRHPMFKAIEAHLAAAGERVDAKWDFKFLEAKDTAFVCMNHMPPIATLLPVAMPGAVFNRSNSRGGGALMICA